VSTPLNLSPKHFLNPSITIWGNLENYKQTCSNSFKIIQVSHLSTSKSPSVAIKSPPTTNSKLTRRTNSNKNNHSPNYSSFSRLKKFLFKETCSLLNLEPGVFKVLIVDDMKQNRIVIQNYLKKIMTVSFEEAVDGLCALDMYNNYARYGFRYQIIFMDLVMPRMTGFEASLRIRQVERDQSFPSTFICAVTGSKDDADKCIDSEINDLGMG
jgi:CheY-like chemotaxis protein